MRQIKFRAFYEDGAPGKQIRDVEGIKYLKRKADQAYLVGGGVVGLDKLMQFTGLHDKNGKEIYEGDILKAKRGEQDGTNTYETCEVVRWSKGGFEVFSRAMSDCYTGDNMDIKRWMWVSPGHLNIPTIYYQITDIEVIGNIWEHKELIEKK